MNQLNTNQKIGLGIAFVGGAIQAASGLVILREYEKLRSLLQETTDYANRSSYLTLYLSVKLAEAGVELDEFDQRILADPPKLIDPANPNLFQELFDRYGEASDDPEVIRAFLDQLRAIRDH